MFVYCLMGPLTSAWLMIWSNFEFFSVYWKEVIFFYCKSDLWIIQIKLSTWVNVILTFHHLWSICSALWGWNQHWLYFGGAAAALCWLKHSCWGFEPVEQNFSALCQGYLLQNVNEQLSDCSFFISLLLMKIWLCNCVSHRNVFFSIGRAL